MVRVIKKPLEPLPKRIEQNVCLPAGGADPRADQALPCIGAALPKAIGAKDHLTNSSSDKKFSKVFSDTVTETLVLAISPHEWEGFFSPGGKVLVKIDVEGYEPALMASFQEIASRYQPDFLIEVLQRTPEAPLAVQ